MKERGILTQQVAQREPSGLPTGYLIKEINKKRTHVLLKERNPEQLKKRKEEERNPTDQSDTETKRGATRRKLLLKKHQFYPKNTCYFVEKGWDWEDGRQMEKNLVCAR